MLSEREGAGMRSSQQRPCHTKCEGVTLHSAAGPAPAACPHVAKHGLSKCYVWETVRAASDWHLVQTEQNNPGLCNSMKCSHCYQQRSGPFRDVHPIELTVRSPVTHQWSPFILIASILIFIIHVTLTKAKASKTIQNVFSSKDNVFYLNDSYNSKSNLSAFFSDLRSNSSAISSYLIRTCYKVSTLKMRVKSIFKNPIELVSLPSVCRTHESIILSSFKLQ